MHEGIRCEKRDMHRPCEPPTAAVGEGNKVGSWTGRTCTAGIRVNTLIMLNTNVQSQID